MTLHLPTLSLIILTLLSSCKDDKVPQQDIHVTIGKFNPDTAYAFIETQVEFGIRHMNSPGHEACKTWLGAKLKFYGFELIEQEFTARAYDGQTLNGTNIIGRHNPDVRERILLCAHYDTRQMAEKDSLDPDTPIDGADDGASGVAVTLEIARQIAINPIPMGVDIIFFDAEDHGANGPDNDYTWGLGSQYWSRNLHEKSYAVKYGILLDMVGARNATFPKEGFSMRSAPHVVNKIWALARQIGRQQYFVDRETGFITDDHRFIIENAGIPMVDIIHVNADGKFGSHHHTHADNLDIIDKRTLEAVGQVVLAVICRESNGEF
jgi:Zn-dependent M28 family amino/carboxypeptidase